MLIKPLILAVIAACGVPSTQSTAEPPPEQPDKKPPGEVKPMDQHFCCQSIDHKSLSGDNCNAISDALEVINACAEVLYCEGNWTKSKGTVRCE
jgi:hypothetical protein